MQQRSLVVKSQEGRIGQKPQQQVFKEQFLQNSVECIYEPGSLNE